MKAEVSQTPAGHEILPVNEKSALLVGNGINNAALGFKWADLVNDLATLVSWPGDLVGAGQPFPLIYEQVYLYGLRAGKLASEAVLKNRIADWTRQIHPSSIHGKILKLRTEHIMTTNYDFCLEQASDCFASVKDTAHNETKFSLFRYYHLGPQMVWHIHGDILRPWSINLGYEQYGGTLHGMRDYVLQGLVRKPIGGKLIDRLDREGEALTVQCWVDLFFLRDIHIFGLGLDPVEMHLWWLLAYRARRMTENSELKRFRPHNRIVYYFPQRYLSDLERAAVTRQRNAMFNAFQVETVGIEGQSTEYYERVLATISDGMNNRV